jgi:hypothetical protein
MAWLLGGIVLLVTIVGLVASALFLRLGLIRGDWLLIVGALLTTAVFVYAVFWLRDAAL